MRILHIVAFLVFCQSLLAQLTFSPFLTGIPLNCNQSAIAYSETIIFTATLDNSFYNNNETIEGNSVNIHWNGTAIGTISNQVFYSSNGRSFEFEIEFPYADAASQLSLYFNVVDTSNVVTVVNMRPSISTECYPQKPTITRIQPAQTYCGYTGNLIYDITSCTPMDQTYLSGYQNDYNLVSTTNLSNGIRVEFSRKDDCDPNHRFSFSYGNNDCGNSKLVTETVSFTLETDNLIQGPSALCLVNNSITDYFGFMVTNAGSDCMTDHWEVLDENYNPTTGATIFGTVFFSGYTVRGVTFTEPGTYKLKVTVNGCGTEPVVEEKTVEICDGVPNLYPTPPAPIANICDNETHCYTFPSAECVDGYDFQYNDNKLIVSHSNNGQTICVSDLLWNGFPRTTYIDVTAYNVCGNSPTETWQININPPIYCDNDNDFSPLQADENSPDQLRVKSKTEAPLELMISPNPLPSGAYLNLDVQAFTDERIHAVLYDITGRELSSETWEMLSGMNTVQMNTSSLKPGIYLLKIIVGDWEEIRKVSIQ